MTLIPKLIGRGRRWCEYAEAKTFEYKGPARSPPAPAPWVLPACKYPGASVADIPTQEWPQVPTRSNWSWEVKTVPKNVQAHGVPK